MVKIYSNFNLPPQDLEKNSGTEVTIPDLAYSIPEIIDMALRGEMEIPMYQEDVTTGQVYNLRASDLTDIYPEVGTNIPEEETIEVPVVKDTSNKLDIEQTNKGEVSDESREGV